MKDFVINLFMRIVGNRLAYRVGRAMYMRARGDLINEISANGELMVQYGAVLASQKEGYGSFVCFDVGANVGDWSSPLVKYCDSTGFPKLHLYMFEPVPAALAALRHRIGDRSDIHYENIALSSRTGKTAMYMAGDSAGTNSLHPQIHGQTTDSIMVETKTMDQYCEENSIQNVHLIKCDTEGHDAEVLYGAMNLLREGRIAIFQFEYNHQWIFSKHSLKEVFDMIKGFRYRLGKVLPTHIELYRDWHPEIDRYFEANYILLREDVLHWFRYHECKPDKFDIMAIAN